MLKDLAPGRHFLDYGPMQLIIEAYRDGIPLTEEIKQSAAYAKNLLEDLAPVLSIAKQPIERIKNVYTLPVILQKMVTTVRDCDNDTLTPMAAVAGAFADSIADYLTEHGATKVIVNNGGDIAIRLSEKDTINVGIASNINLKGNTHVAKICYEDNINGIATSGLGGRSFTKGIATAAVVLASNCRIADACATLIGNSTYHPDPGIVQEFAENIDPDTDIPGHLVTINMDNVSEQTKLKALENGILKAKELCQRQIINGSIIFINEYMSVQPEELINLI